MCYSFLHRHDTSAEGDGYTEEFGTLLDSVEFCGL